MNEHETELRLRDWLDAQAPSAVPDELLKAVTAIPATVSPGWSDRLATALGWRPVAVPRPVWILVAAALLLALAATTLYVGARLLEPQLPLPPGPIVLVPSASPSILPTPSPSPTPLVLDPSSAHWTELGTTDASSVLAAFDGGYVALGSLPTDDTPYLGHAAFFSADGVSWTSTPLATLVPNCPDWGPPGAEDVPDAEARAITSNGRELVIVGEESPHDASSCANVATSVRPVAWHSSDGSTWRRSEPFEVAGPNARATAVWAIPSGWQAAVQGAATGTISVWESLDGLAWYQVMEPVAVGDVNVYAGAAPDGTVVMSRWADETSGLRLFTSRDGRTWESVETAGGCEQEPGVTQVVGPAARDLDTWVLLDDMRLCTSRDLRTWSGTTMTVALSTIAQTRFGAMVLGDGCYGAGATCPPDPRAFLSADGVTWTPIAHPPVYWGRAVADGPAGVLMVGQATEEGGSMTVWRLDP
jgi:hypothetical protein